MGNGDNNNIEELKREIERLRTQVEEMQANGKKPEIKRNDISSRIKNRDKLSYVFQVYDNICIGGKFTGKVSLRHSSFLPSGFSQIRSLAKTITDYPQFSRRDSDNCVSQQIVKRNLDQLDDAELSLVADCADEIIDVLYKYKLLCMEQQGMDYGEFVDGGVE